MSDALAPIRDVERMLANIETVEDMDPALHGDSGKYQGEGHVLDGGARAWLESV